MNLVHLHNHTQYSLLDGLCKIKDTVSRAKELGFTSYAITDHGNMFGVVSFYQECVKQGIKPIIGCEFYISPRGRKDKTERSANHLILLAKNYTGYLNLMELSTKAHLEGFYYKPRIDREILSQHAEGLICMSACLKGEIAESITNNNKDVFLDTVDYYKHTFGEDFYFELQNHGLKEEDKVREILIKNAKAKKVKLVCTNDVHYLNKQDWEAHDTLLCVQTGKKLADTDRMRYETHELYMKSYDEMEKLFPKESIENTLLIDSLCNVEIPLGKNLLPVFPCDNLDTKFKEEIRKGGVLRYKSMTPEIKKRINYEYQTIKKLGFSSYFLIVQDFIRYAKSVGVSVGPGRGSVGGSVVAYCLGITDVDPIKYNLIFERFLNPDRVSLPDIDVDFSDRDKIIDYVTSKYGSDNVAQIVTFGTLGGRAVVRDVGRTLGIPISAVDKIAKLIDQKLSLEENFKHNPHLKPLMVAHGIDPTHLLKLEDINRQASVHASAVLISPDKITSHCPLMFGKAGVIASQYDMKVTEALGLLKMDFLGLKTLSVIDECCKATGVDIKNIPLDDKNTYDLISKGLTVGIFQFESAGMREFLVKLEPRNIDDMAVAASLYRPGPMDIIPSYIERRNKKEEIEYPHFKTEKTLKPTLGYMIFQEQVIQITRDLAGFTLAEGDILRKAIGKKDKELLLAQKDKFINGCEKEGNGKKVGENVFGLIEKFANYGFNKCLSGDTTVMVSGRKNGASTGLLKIKEIYDVISSSPKNNAESSRKYKYKKGICVFGSTSDHTRTKKVKIIDVIYNGNIDVFEIKTESGHVIKATGNHKFICNDAWTEVSDMLVGDILCVTDYKTDHKTNKYNFTNLDASAHNNLIMQRIGDGPFKSGTSAPGYVNGQKTLFKKNRAILKSIHKNCQLCGVKSDKFDTHHIDCDYTNNDLSNLMILCKKCHRNIHTKMNGGKKGILGHIVYKSKIISITAVGKEDVYDIEIDDPSHAFFANGILTHNSHAVGYAILAYQTAYLKANHPVEFMCALLNSEIGDLDRISTIIYDCNKLGLTILPPSINKSNDKFSVEDGKIRFGLQSIRNIGEDFANEIKANRPYTSLVNLCMKVKPAFYNSRKLESLVSAGCFDEFGTRKGHVDAIETINKTSRNQDYHSLFEPNIEICKANFTLDESAQREREALGIYFMYNPLYQYKVDYTPISELIEDETSTVLCIADQIKKKTNNRGDTYFIKVVDLASSMECILFGGVIKGEPPTKGEAYLINGRLNSGKFMIKNIISAKAVL